MTRVRISSGLPFVCLFDIRSLEICHSILLAAILSCNLRSFVVFVATEAGVQISARDFVDLSLVVKWVGEIHLCYSGLGIGGKEEDNWKLAQFSAQNISKKNTFSA